MPGLSPDREPPTAVAKRLPVRLLLSESGASLAEAMRHGVRVPPIQNKSSTEQYVGPSFVGNQVAPESSLAYRPTSVPA